MNSTAHVAAIEIQQGNGARSAQERYDARKDAARQKRLQAGTTSRRAGEAGIVSALSGICAEIREELKHSIDHDAAPSDHMQLLLAEYTAAVGDLSQLSGDARQSYYRRIGSDRREAQLQLIDRIGNVGQSVGNGLATLSAVTQVVGQGSQSAASADSPRLQLLLQLIAESDAAFREWCGKLGDIQELMIPPLIRSGFMTRRISYTVKSPDELRRQRIEVTGVGYDGDVMAAIRMASTHATDLEACQPTTDEVRLSFAGQQLWSEWKDCFDLEWLLTALTGCEAGAVTKPEVLESVGPSPSTPTNITAAQPEEQPSVDAGPNSVVANPAALLTVDINNEELTFRGVTYSCTSERALRWVRVLASNPGVWISARELAKFDSQLLEPRTDQLTRFLPEAVRACIESSTGKGSRFIAQIDQHHDG